MIEIEITALVAEMTGLLEKPIYNYSGTDVNLGGRIIQDQSTTTEVIYDNGYKFRRGKYIANVMYNADNVILVKEETCDGVQAFTKPSNIKTVKELILEVTHVQLIELEGTIDNVFTARYQEWKSDESIFGFRLPLMAGDYDDPPEPRRVDEGDVGRTEPSSQPLREWRRYSNYSHGTEFP